ncbi:MAG TPA: carbohydrate ABC transporter permease [Dongiaceae bacterium]|nr:carbohydrate ABC transporter permease [Dongiaceae bacterium]
MSADRSVARNRGSRRNSIALAGTILLAVTAFVWMTPFLWMLVAALRPDNTGADIASLWPSIHSGMGNFVEAWTSGDFPLWYFNTILLCGGILIVQLITITMAGYAFARLDFPGRQLCFYLFLLQLMLVPPVLIVPNLVLLSDMGLYDTLVGVMAPYFASAFGVFLMRQTFKTIPRDFEEAALVDGATPVQILWRVLVPLAKPGLIAFSIVSVTAHWNEFLWPLMATTSPSNQVLTVGLASFARGAESASQWGVIAAGTFLVAAPLLIAFILFQRRFVSSFVFTGIK